MIASLATTAALGLALLDAACFGAAALLQHRGVRRVSEPYDEGRHRRRLPVRAFGQLLREPTWMLGSALIVVGTLLHVAALALAPLAVIQPVGVLAVPFAVVLAARLRRRAPAPALIAGVAMSVLGTGAFVLLASHSNPRPALALGPLLIAAAVLAVTVAVVWQGTARLRPILRCAGFAVVGAVSFGFGSTLVRLVAGSAATDYRRLADPTNLLAVVVMIVAVTIGGWAVQQAYAAGSAEVVIATLTVGDPLIAVLLGMTLLGEEAGVGWLTRVAMVICGLVAAGGVVLAARYHPAAVASGEQPGERRIEPARMR